MKGMDGTCTRLSRPEWQHGRVPSRSNAGYRHRGPGRAGPDARHPRGLLPHRGRTSGSPGGHT